MKTIVMGAAVAGVSAVLWGCASGGGGGTALERVTSRGSAERGRIEAIPGAKAEAAGTEAATAGYRTALARIAWDSTEVPSVRAAAIRAVLDEPEGEFQATCRQTARNILPHESSREVVLTLCDVAAAKGWKDFAAPMVRSYARVVKMVPGEQDRAERQGLERLFPGRSVEETIFEVFVGAPSLAESARGTERTRQEAWDALARVDKTGDVRAGLVQGYAGSDADVELMRAGLRDLRAMPRTGEELLWLKRLREGQAAWWPEATAAVARAPVGGRLSLRHAEVLRWAAAARPAWLGMSREQLLGELANRVQGRQHFERTGDPSNMRPRESVEVVGPKLAWADLIAVLALDDAVHTPGLGATLCEQVRLDQRDQTTEYGGIVRLGSGNGGAAQLALFPPRPGERQGDNKFIASPDMIVRSDTAAAHFHFHAQTWRNHDVAGPSTGDFEYAARFGRSCLVFTTVKDCELSVDYYQPDGSTIDLGTIGGK